MREYGYWKNMDPEEYIAFAESIKLVYISVAKQILEDTGIKKGFALDLSSGPGYLGFEIIKMTELNMVFMDLNQSLLKSMNKIDNQLFREAFSSVAADAHSLPFKDNEFDLIVSRGAFHFWKNEIIVFSEIYRTLKPGGQAYIGGGFGRYLNDIDRKACGSAWQKQWVGKERELTEFKMRIKRFSPEYSDEISSRTGLVKKAYIKDLPGIWLHLCKRTA